MARGKQANASVMRRYVTAEEHLKAYKRENRAQLNRIHVLEHEVAHTRGLQERCDTLTMELELATGPEVRRLNEMVGHQREQIRALEERCADIQRKYDRILEVASPPRPGVDSVASHLEECVELLGPEVSGLPNGVTVRPRGTPDAALKHLNRERMLTLRKIRGEA